MSRALLGHSLVHTRRLRVVHVAHFWAEPFKTRAVSIFDAPKVRLSGSPGSQVHYANYGDEHQTTTLSYDGTNFTEYFNNGMQMVYTAQLAGTPIPYPLVRIVSPSGVIHSYLHGTGVEAGLLKNIQVPGGNTVSFLYTSGVATSLLQTVQDWSNRRWTFQYDAHNYMTTMITPLGCQTGYAYSLAGSPVTLVQAITDPRGFTTSYQFDSNRRVVTMSAGTAIWTYAYFVGSSNNVVMVSPSGAVTTTIYDIQGNIGTHASGGWERRDIGRRRGSSANITWTRVTTRIRSVGGPMWIRLGTTVG